VAYQVENIYETCQELMDKGLTLNLPPRDGFMAFVKSPDGISFELLQKGGPRPPEEPWTSMPDQGTW
jgi:lactoylglutathione lyase